MAAGAVSDLSPAGGAYTGAALVGASPELLVARRGDVVTCRPFAGSAPRLADPERVDIWTSERQTRVALRRSPLRPMPLVVLTNAGSSASTTS